MVSPADSNESLEEAYSDRESLEGVRRQRPARGVKGFHSLEELRFRFHLGDIAQRGHNI